MCNVDTLLAFLEEHSASYTTGQLVMQDTFIDKYKYAHVFSLKINKSIIDVFCLFCYVV